MAEPYTDEELAEFRRDDDPENTLLPLHHVLATLDARDAAHRQEIAERDARIAEMEADLEALHYDLKDAAR